MRPINNTKKYSEILNNSKNKLNSKINWLFKLSQTQILVPTFLGFSLLRKAHKVICQMIFTFWKKKEFHVLLQWKMNQQETILQLSNDLTKKHITLIYFRFISIFCNLLLQEQNKQKTCFQKIKWEREREGRDW